MGTSVLLYRISQLTRAKMFFVLVIVSVYRHISKNLIVWYYNKSKITEPECNINRNCVNVSVYIFCCARTLQIP